MTQQQNRIAFGVTGRRNQAETISAGAKRWTELNKRIDFMAYMGMSDAAMQKREITRGYSL